jgi:hypothetical protein
MSYLMYIIATDATELKKAANYFSQTSRHKGRYLNPGPSNHDAAVYATRPPCSMVHFVGHSKTSLGRG